MDKNTKIYISKHVIKENRGERRKEKRDCNQGTYKVYIIFKKEFRCY